MRLTTRRFPRVTAPTTVTALAAVAGSIVSWGDLGPWLAPALLPWAQGLSLLWLGRGLVWLARMRAQQRAWTHSPDWAMTPQQIPVRKAGMFVGKAFAWTGHHTQFLETALALDKALPVAEGARGGYPVLHAVGQCAEQDWCIPWSELVGHTLMTGTTRSGKTRTLEVMATGSIAYGGATIVLDPKGDRDLLLRCAVEACRQHKSFALIAPAFPRQSACMNVLDTARTPAEVSTRINALMPAGGRDPFFREYPLALIERIASAQHALGIPWTLEGLYRPAVLAVALEQLTTQYFAHLGYPTARGWKQARDAYKKTGGTDPIADALLDDVEKPRDHFVKVTANLIPAFRGVVGDPLGPLFSSLPADVTWQQIVDKEMVVYVALASMVIGDIANRIGRVMLQDLVGFLGRRYAYEDCTAASPITVIIDEAARVVYPHFPAALAMAGGANARFILAQQSLADMEAGLGDKALARQVYDNMNTRLWHRVADDATALEATEGLGTCLVDIPEEGTALAYGGIGGLSGNSSRRFTKKAVPLIRPNWLTALPRGEAFVRMKGELWKLRVPVLTPITRQDLEAVGLVETLAALPEGEETRRLGT
jgi:conjugal transfer pilus assembly protein TraD